MREEQLGSGGIATIPMAKVDRNGKASVLTDDEMEALLEAAPSPRYRCLWSIQRWSAARISEALQLRWADVNGSITYRRATTKTNTTRQVPTIARLSAEIEAYRTAWEAEHGHPPARDEVLFPARESTHTPMTRQAVDKALRQVCDRLGLVGVSTHSFRRTMATDANRRGVSLCSIQRVTGHKKLGTLAEYIDIDEADILAAIGG